MKIQRKIIIKEHMQILLFQKIVSTFRPFGQLFSSIREACCSASAAQRSSVRLLHGCTCSVPSTTHIIISRICLSVQPFALSCCFIMHTLCTRRIAQLNALALFSTYILNFWLSLCCGQFLPQWALYIMSPLVTSHHMFLNRCVFPLCCAVCCLLSLSCRVSLARLRCFFPPYVAGSVLYVLLAGCVLLLASYSHFSFLYRYHWSSRTLQQNPFSEQWCTNNTCQWTLCCMLSPHCPLLCRCSSFFLFLFCSSPRASLCLFPSLRLVIVFVWMWRSV